MGPTKDRDATLIDEQIAYYRARASEYDEWFLRERRYDRGPLHRAEWTAEIRQLEAWLQTMMPLGDVLEIACGTGLWTQVLARGCRRLLAVDASPEVIALNKCRLSPLEHSVEYETVDVFSWKPSTTFDAVFFSFWLSHVPNARFDSFWQTVRGALKSNGQALFIDSLPEPSSTAQDHEPPDESGVVRRKLNDGRQFEIVKVFYDPTTLTGTLSSRGWAGSVRSTGKFFLYGSFRPTEETPVPLAGRRRRA